MQKKILIIEEDLHTSEVLAHLIGLCGYEVEVIMSILPLSDILLVRPHLIVLDYKMANGLGGMFCRRLKHAESTKHIPVIMISPNPDIANIANEYSPNKWISKPFDIDEIEEKIGELLNRNGPGLCF